MKSEKSPGFRFTLLIDNGFLTKGRADQCEHSSIHPGAWFDDMRHKMLLGLFVKILERFTADLLMLSQVIIGSISDAFHLLHTKREVKFNVVCALGIMSAFRRRNFMD